MECLVLALSVLFSMAVCDESLDMLRPSAYGIPGELNDACRSIKDCRSFGYLCKDNRTCQCDQWYIPDAQNKRCVGGVNQKCIYDEHCIEGAYCHHQSVCKCKESSPYAFEDGLVCAKSVQMKASLMLGFAFVALLVLL